MKGQIMKETNFKDSHTNIRGGSRSDKVVIATIFGVVLITFILAGCFLTTLIMMLDAIPFQHIF